MGHRRAAYVLLLNDDDQVPTGSRVIHVLIVALWLRPVANRGRGWVQGFKGMTPVKGNIPTLLSYPLEDMPPSGNLLLDEFKPMVLINSP